MYTKSILPLMVTSALLTSQLQAGLTQDILAGITDGSRTIRAEVTSLKTVAVPEPTDLGLYVKDKQRAIELGKALFWDMQVGTDGVQACASCHFAAGADNRTKNQLSPGLFTSNQDGSENPDKAFDVGTGANYQLKSSDFPRHIKSDPLLFVSNVLRDSNDVVSSQGVHYSVFVNTDTGPTAAADPDGFTVNGVNTRRVATRNTPTVINAVFNHRQFWDGLASNIFNGVNPFGDNDPYAFVYKKSVAGDLEAVRVSINNASLASQAMGPPLSSFEMSADGRTWTDIGDSVLGSPADHGNEEKYRKKGKRVLNVRPLLQQKVSPTDSVLGQLASNTAPGLKVKSYAQMIRRAFNPEWWNSGSYVQINADGSRTIVNTPTGDETYSQMEMNFSLFFGLAVQLYEATLVADDSPVDRYLDGDTNALSQAELVGFHLADDEGRCINCHGRGEFTYAAVSRINERGLTRIRKGDLIDEGFNNIGVRPTLDDLGVGGTDPFGNPLGFARRTHNGQYDNPLIAGTADELAADLGDDGAFKIPTLRNVELTAPYFHNGAENTLEDVIDFYFRGGNFRTFDAANSHPIIGYTADRVNESPITGLGILRGTLLNSGPGLDDEDKANLVAFLKALTDQRVVYRKAPFDHPQLFIPNGHTGDHTAVVADDLGLAADNFIEIPAVGAGGGAPLPTFNDNLPF